MRTTPTVSKPPVKVSVVVPTHNTGRTVLTGLRSFLAQTMPRSDFEVVYVDDGSTDDTVAILESELARQEAESAVRVIRTGNSGWPGRPRNIGVDEARGEFVHFVDDDDWLAPEALERTYERARETGADIVIGRMAGHGRRAPRVLFEKPLASADLRTSANALLTSMTVHKLFRRDFLRDHGLRFAEGPVRLEDHMFTLRAYLLTDRVATVHDYTCYHWVRHRGDEHNNISYGKIDPGPYVDSVRKVLAILEAPDTRVASARRRHRLAANWYGKKALARISGERYLAQPDHRKTEWFEAVGALAADMPPEADAALPTRLRIVAALARHHDRTPLDEYAKFEAAVDQQPHVHSAKWDDGGRLTVRCGTRLVRKSGKGARSVPLAFSRTRGRHRLRLTPGTGEAADAGAAPDTAAAAAGPPEIAAVDAVPGVAEAADFTSAVRRSSVRGLLRHREGGTVLSVPLDHRVVEEPLRNGKTQATAPEALKTLTRAAGGAARRLSERLGLPGSPGSPGSHPYADGPDPRDERAEREAADQRAEREAHDQRAERAAHEQGDERDDCALSFETEFTVDPATADNGRPLAPGTWDLQLQLGFGGWRAARTLRGYSIDVPAENETDRPRQRTPKLRRPVLQPAAW
ncbi:glycosyltransferase family 2 protein [Streptomyces sp. HNM0575]|uniref:glycosyltransferase n=1 Tax=Streptomyces sp. HNM0575 TaxID=2716338 RepID=UPI00145E4D0E|nr:glycosyltransferase family 2 protein [Streptomyces sp. HNM0575]